MEKITKETALQIIFSCAEMYKENLVGRNILFVYLDENKKTKAVEVFFKASNFLHLTGLRLLRNFSAKEFYRLCLAKRLKISDFDFAKDGTTPLKLEVLPHLMNKNISAKMIGDSLGRYPRLFTEKFAGNVTCCMGFMQTDKIGYVPNTVLKSDLRDNVKNAHRIILIYSKLKGEPTYATIVYAAKGLDWKTINLPDGYPRLPLPSFCGTEIETALDYADDMAELSDKRFGYDEIFNKLRGSINAAIHDNPAVQSAVVDEKTQSC